MCTLLRAAELLEQMQSTAEVLPEALRPTYNRLAGAPGRMRCLALHCWLRMAIDFVPRLAN